MCYRPKCRKNKQKLPAAFISSGAFSCFLDGRGDNRRARDVHKPCATRLPLCGSPLHHTFSAYERRSLGEPNKAKPKREANGALSCVAAPNSRKLAPHLRDICFPRLFPFQCGGRGNKCRAPHVHKPRATRPPPRSTCSPHTRTPQSPRTQQI